LLCRRLVVIFSPDRGSARRARGLFKKNPSLYTTPQSRSARQLPCQGANFLSDRRGGPRSGGEVVHTVEKIFVKKCIEK